MAETVRPDPFYSGATTCVVDDPGDAAGAERCPRRDRPQEHGPRLGARTALREVVSHRLADVDWERHLLHPVALAVHDDLAEVPVDVVEAKARDLPRPQPEAGEEEQDGVVAPPSGVLAVAARKEPAARVRGDPTGHARVHAPCHRWHRLRERRVHEALDMTEAQEGAERRCEVLGCRGAPTRQLLDAERADLGRADRRGAVREAGVLGEEPCRDA